MPLKMKIASLDEVHESLQDLYEQTDDGFTLTPPEGFVAADSVEDVSGLKSALDKEREAARKAVREKKAALDKFGSIDVDKYNQLIEAEATAAEADALAKGEFEKVKGQMSEQHATALSEKDKEIARLTGQIKHLQVESAATTALADAGGNVELLKPHLLSRLKLDTDDFTVKVLEADGTTPKVDASGNPVNIEVLVREMRESDTFSSGFKATEQSGSGSEPQKGGDASGDGKPNGGTPPAGTKPRSQMTDREKIDFQKAHGIDALLKLPD